MGIRWGSLRTKIITWSFVPAALILAAVAWVVFISYQRVTEDLVIERNQQLVRSWADGLAAQLTGYATLLTEYAGALANLPTSAYAYEGDVIVQESVLRRAQARFSVFDGGVLVLDGQGTVVASEPKRPEIMGQSWADRPYFGQMLRSPGAVFSDVVADGPGWARVIVVAVPIKGDHGQFLGMIAGMFCLSKDASNPLYTGIAQPLEWPDGALPRAAPVGSGNAGKRGSVYLIDSAGQVIYHSDPLRIGDDFSAQTAARRVLAGQVGALRARDLQEQEIVASFAPVSGTSWGLVVEEAWANLISGSRGYQRFLLFLLALGVAAPALVVAIGSRRITRPIVDLIGAAQRVAEGHFDAGVSGAITARAGDEIEELAGQFDRMAAQLQASYARLEQRVADRTKELAALNAISAVVSQSLDLEEILNDALDKTLEVIGVQAGGVYLLDAGSRVLQVAVHRGLDDDLVAEIDGLELGEGFSGRVVQSDMPLVVEDVFADPRLAARVARIKVRDGNTYALVSVPLSSWEGARGALFVIAPDVRRFTEQDVQFLSSIGHQIGIAVENARHLIQTERRTQEEERSRLARELHDAVTQTLFSASLIAEVLPELWANDPDEGRLLLHELQQLSRGALAEMRTLLLELRPTALVEASLESLLSQLAEAITGREGVPVRVTIEGHCDLPPDVHVALYRIAQEALNNVVKHAQASQVEVSLRCSTRASQESDHTDEAFGSPDGEQVELSISDDGRGFDPGAVPPGRLGLGIIRERAQAIGATCDINTKPGCGTQIRVVCVAHPVRDHMERRRPNELV